jgi:hypothetical protein
MYYNGHFICLVLVSARVWDGGVSDPSSRLGMVSVFHSLCLLAKASFWHHTHVQPHLAEARDSIGTQKKSCSFEPRVDES